MSISNESNNKKKNGVRVVILLIAIVLIAVGTAMTVKYFYERINAEKDASKLTQITTTQEATVENPIDFASLKETNDEIYAWINVPGTKVDYPVLQSTVSDDFYLKHSATDKKYSASGAVYTQSLNTTSFNDRVTVIYGHNGYGDTFFTTLHNFEDAQTFDENEYFYIYTPNSKLTYQIVSAFKYDDRHILNSFNFQSNNIFEEFIAMIQNPTSTNKNVRENLDKEITINDRLVVLSTCITGQKSSRYLVCGVLVNNEQTN